MTVESFDFPTKNLDTEDSDFADGSWAPFPGGDSCNANVLVSKLMEKGHLVGETSLIDTAESEDFWLFWLNQSVIAFDSPKQADEFIKLTRNGLDDTNCLSDYKTKSEDQTIESKGSAESVLGVGSDNSTAFSRKSTWHETGGLQQEFYYYDAFIAVNNYVVILSSSFDPQGYGITVEQVKEAVKSGITQMLE